MRARAWCRVDLAGGTLDIWPLGLLHRGSTTVNLAVDLPVEVDLSTAGDGFRVRQGDGATEAESAEELLGRPGTALVGLVALELGLPPVEVRIASASPRGGGLGASSALAVALIASAERLLGRPASEPRQTAALARDLEARLMGLPTGLQDHLPALLGGVLEIAHRPGGERVRALEVDAERLGESLILAYTGVSHVSAATNWGIIRRRLEGDAETVELFDGITAAARDLAPALERGDLPEVGRLMAAEWACRRRLAEGVSTPLLERLLAAAAEAGAWGGKACGAGGGGCLALLGPPEARASIEDRLAALGAEILSARPALSPLRLEVGAA